MKKHVFNYDQSLLVYKACNQHLQPKDCYRNVFKTISFFSEKFHSGEWKIAYGFFSVLPNELLITRHCFLVNEAGEAIDPSLIVVENYKVNEPREYFSFTIFNSLDEYLDVIEKNLHVPDLLKALQKHERIVEQKLRKEGFFVIG